MVFSENQRQLTESPTFDAQNPAECLATLKRLLELGGFTQELSLLAKSKTRFQLWSSDSDWDRTSYGYAMHISVPVEVYNQIADQREQLEEILKSKGSEIFRAYRNDWLELVSISVQLVTNEQQNERPATHITEETMYEKAYRLKLQLISACTQDSYDGQADYEQLRGQLMTQPALAGKIPSVVKLSRSLKESRQFMQKLFAHYAERREYLHDKFETLISSLEREPDAPVDELFTGKLSVFDSAHICEVWQKAIDRRTTDPEGAITTARTLLESVCKHILEELNCPYDNNADLPKLYGLVSGQLNLSPSQHSADVFKQILGGCHSVVQGLGSLRNKLSDAHGRGKIGTKPASRHAELAVNLAGSVALFLISTLESKDTISSNQKLI